MIYKLFSLIATMRPWWYSVWIMATHRKLRRAQSCSYSEGSMDEERKTRIHRPDKPWVSFYQPPISDRLLIGAFYTIRPGESGLTRSVFDGRLRPRSLCDPFSAMRPFSWPIYMLIITVNTGGGRVTNARLRWLVMHAASWCVLGTWTCAERENAKSGTWFDARPRI